MSEIKTGVLYYDKVKLEYQYGLINEKSNFVICGYYWGHFKINPNSRDKMTYGQLAQRLIDSCIKNNCNYFLANIEEFAKPGGYQRAINYKTTFLLHTLDFIYPRAAINLDTDMKIDKYPSLFDIDFDYFGFNWYQDPRSVAGYFPIECYDPYVLRTSGGIMGIGNTLPARQFLKQWDELMKHPKMLGKAEDVVVSVEFALNNWIAKMRCLWLPVEMFSIPYFYDHDDYWFIEKKYQKFFPHIKFYGDESDKEYSFDKFYKIKPDSYYISHPEALTEEEVAAQQGASNNRVPEEYLVETGKKLRCLTKTGKMCNIPSLYCDTKEQEKALSGLNKSLDFLKWNVLEKMPSIKNKCKFKILSERIANPESYLYIFSGNHPEDLKGFSGNYVVIEIYENCFKSFIISQILKKYSKVYGAIFLENCLNCMDAIKLEKEPDLISSDFGCINGNSRETPCYKGTIIEPCYDVRALNTITTDILYFRNNKYGINMLTLWNHCSGGVINKRSISKKIIDDRQALSIAFNKYGCIVFMRVLWFHPSYFCPDSQNIFKKPLNDPVLLFDSVVKPLNKNVDLCDYFKQCGNRSKVPSFSNLMAKDAHYRGSKWRK